MTNQPPFATVRKYTIQQEDIENMMRSGVPGETVSAKVVTLPTHQGLVEGWQIEVTRPLYGEDYCSLSFISLAMVAEGPDWVDEQHRIIDKSFEAARREHPKAKH